MPTRVQRLSTPARLLLTLTAGSIVVRVTDGDLIEVAQGQTGADPYVFLPGLQPVASVARSLEWFDLGVSARSISVEVLSRYDWAALAARGIRLDAATAELAEHYEGAGWNERRVLLAGRVENAIPGPVGEPLAFSISEVQGEDQGRIISSTAIVNDETFPRASVDRETPYTGTNPRSNPDIFGAAGPIIIGAPGQGAVQELAGVRSSFPVFSTPGLYVEMTDSTAVPTDHIFLLARHPVLSSAARIRFDDVEEDCVVAHGVDKLGQRFAYAPPPLVGAIPTSTTSSITVSWDIADGGGMPNPFGTGPLRRANDVIRWALGLSTRKVDQSQIGRLHGLRSYLIDGFINDPSITAWDWLTGNILPLLPVSTANSGSGIYLAVWDPDASQDDAVLRLEEGRNAQRLTSPALSDAGRVRNRIRINFGPGITGGQYAQYRVLGGKRTGADAESVYTAESLWCRRSQAVYGVREHVIETPYIYDGATAELVLQWQARAYAFPHTSAGYMLSRAYDHLELGDVVLLTDTELSLSAVVAHVQAVQPEPGGISVLLTWWDPLRYSQ